MSKKKKKKNKRYTPPANGGKLPLQENLKTNIPLQRKSVSIQSISSPIPPPEIMKEYNALMPEATEKFFSLAKKQSDHRQELEKVVINSQNKRAMAGLISGWLATIILASYATFLLYHDKDVNGYIYLVASFLPRIISFFVARYDRKKQIEESKKIP